MKMKKTAAAAAVLAFGLVCGAVGAGAATGIQQIKAALNYNLKFSLDGESWAPKDGNGKTMAPIVYKGSTYLPARAMSEALGAEITLNGNTISIDSGESGIPYNDGDTSSGTSGGTSSDTASSRDTASSSGGTTSSASGGQAKETTNAASETDGMTADTAIPVGQALTYTDPYSSNGRQTTSTYTVTVKGAKTITRDQIAAYGFKKPEEEADVEYKLVSVKLELKNGKLIKNGYLDTTFLNTMMPHIWGSKTADGGGIIGGTDYGFDGALQDAVEDAAGFKTLKEGESGSYSAAGYIILPVQKGKTNYFVLQLENTDDYEHSFKFFALQ